MRQYASATLAFSDCLRTILAAGVKSSPRGQDTVEITSHGFILDDPRNRLVEIPERPIRKDYAAANVAWNLGCSNDVDSICWWNPNGRKISDDQFTFHGANYGQRWRWLLPEAIDLLRADPDTRRAWVQIYDGQEDLGCGYSREGKDVPCTVGFGLRILNGALVMQVIMRSQNVVGVMPYDIFLFTTLQELIANELEVSLGWYEHHCMSAHVYARDLEIANRIISSDIVEPPPMKRLPSDLTDAQVWYPEAMNALMKGAEISDEESDPLVELMEEGAHEKLTDTVVGP